MSATRHLYEQNCRRSFFCASVSFLFSFHDPFFSPSSATNTSRAVSSASLAGKRTTSSSPSPHRSVVNPTKGPCAPQPSQAQPGPAVNVLRLRAPLLSKACVLLQEHGPEILRKVRVALGHGELLLSPQSKLRHCLIGFPPTLKEGLPDISTSLWPASRPPRCPRS